MRVVAYSPRPVTWGQTPRILLVSGSFDQMLRVWDAQTGELMPTTEERELTARRRADSAEALLEEAREDLQQECERAEKERKRAELLAEKLRSLGIDPDAA